MKFKVKDLDIATGEQAVVVFHEKDVAKLDLHAGDRVLVKSKKRKTTAIFDIAESSKHFRPGKIGCFEEVLDKLHIKEGSIVEVSFARKPNSICHIRKKLDGKRLTDIEYDSIVSDIVADELSEGELTYFISGCYANKMSVKEISGLSKAIVKYGDRMNHFRRIVLDKHCSGGVPGNRTTMLVVPIIAAAGFLMPKTSSRSITSPAGTPFSWAKIAALTTSAM